MNSEAARSPLSAQVGKNIRRHENYEKHCAIFRIRPDNGDVDFGQVPQTACIMVRDLRAGDEGGKIPQRSKQNYCQKPKLMIPPTSRK